jgi:tRNA/tmRNA/rRNA uracil-C5-methylase (TrmA/RlmC/RlmD family)
MKQTAREWIFNEMERLRVNAKINNMDDYKFIIRSAEIFEQAKEMEKQQLESLKDFDTWKEWKNKL